MTYAPSLEADLNRQCGDGSAEVRPQSKMTEDRAAQSVPEAKGRGTHQGAALSGTVQEVHGKQPVDPGPASVQESIAFFAASPDHGILHAPVFPRLGPEAGSHADGLHAARRPSKRPKALDGSIHDSHNTSKPQPKSLKLDSTVAGPSMALIRGEGQSAGRKRKASSEPEDPEKRSRNDADLPGSEQTPGPKEKPKILNFKLGPVAHGYRPAPSFTFSSPADLDPIKAAPQRRNMLVVDVDALGDSIKLQRQLREKDGVGLLWTDAGGSLHAAPLLPLPS
ncbi:hypothetical protein BC567DRAFT_208690 [Phyllosticta citribraziliensis]